MHPVKFDEANTLIGANQPEYITVPAYVDPDGQQVSTCWALTWKERLIVLITGHVFLHQLTFGNPLQPQLVSLEGPAVPGKDDAEIPA